jgi:hypothetical protein
MLTGTDGLGYLERMVKSPSLSDPYEAAAAPLRAREARLVVELEAVRKSLAAIAATRDASDFAVSQVLAEYPPSEVSNKFKGMGLGEALTKQLAESDHVEKTAKQLWTAIHAAGFRILSSNPEGAANWALRKREKKEGDVLLIGDGKWGMTEWYSPGQIQRFRASRTNASGRNHAEHVEKTKAGIANAKKTRLNHWGRKRTITGEQMTAAYNEFQRGARSKLQLAKAAAMAWPTFNLYWSDYEMENWRPGDSFPPKRREMPRKKIRLEEMWPREKSAVNGHAKDNEPQLTLRPAE